MKSIELGITGIQIPMLGLGTWQYQGGIEPLRAGMDLGANFIDTAEAYGTEPIVGDAIKGKRKDIFLATKVSARHFRHRDLIKAADDSLRRLNTEYLDLYQLHWPNYTVPLQETMNAMESLVEAGKVRFLGVSNFMIGDLKRAQKALVKQKIVSNQVRYSLIDRTIEGDLLRYCQESKITIIAHSPLATSMDSLQARDPDNILGRLAKTHSRTTAQVALNWCIAKQGIVTIPKANRPEHVRENCAASDFQLSDEELQLLNEKISFHKRSSLEIALRRTVRHALQMVGRDQ